MKVLTFLIIHDKDESVIKLEIGENDEVPLVFYRYLADLLTEWSHRSQLDEFLDYYLAYIRFQAE